MNPVELPSCGLHYGVSFEEYQRWPAANFSKIKPIGDTASKCRYAMEHPKEMTPAMVLGSALHMATLEPARFEQMFHICPPCDRRTTEGKELFAKEQQKSGNKILIRQGSKDDESLMGEVEAVRGMSKAIHSLKSAQPFIAGAGRNEVSLLWKDVETGLMCKARLDRLIETGFEFPIILELKSTRDASRWGFAKEIDKNDYDAQAASYCHGYEVITGRKPLHLFQPVENFPPFDAPGPFALDDRSMQTGLMKYRQMLRRYAECVKTGVWPGYPDVLGEIALPSYANERKYGND